MAKKPPFAIATAVALPAATPDFAKDLYVANAARSPDGNMVTIASSSDHNFKKYLSTNGIVEGYGIASIEWSERVGATKVTISKDGKFATLTFNQALLALTPPTAPPVPTQVGPALPVMQQPSGPRPTPPPQIQPDLTEQIEELKKLQSSGQDIPGIPEKIELLKKMQNGQDPSGAPSRPN